MKTKDLYKLNDGGFDRSSVRWATEKHVDHARGYGKMLQNPERGDHSVIWVHIQDLMDQQHRDHTLDLFDPTGGENSIGDRVRRAKAHWASGGYMNPVEAAIDERDGHLHIGDGRHRLVAAFQAGHRYAPIIIPSADVSKVKQTGIRIKT